MALVEVRVLQVWPMVSATLISNGGDCEGAMMLIRETTKLVKSRLSTPERCHSSHAIGCFILKNF